MKYVCFQQYHSKQHTERLWNLFQCPSKLLFQRNVPLSDLRGNGWMENQEKELIIGLKGEIRTYSARAFVLALPHAGHGPTLTVKVARSSRRRRRWRYCHPFDMVNINSVNICRHLHAFKYPSMIKSDSGLNGTDKPGCRTQRCSLKMQKPQLDWSGENL